MAQTKREPTEVLSFILSYFATHGEYPSQRTMAEKIPMSLATVNKFLGVLTEKRLIRVGTGSRVIWASSAQKKD